MSRGVIETNSTDMIGVFMYSVVDTQYNALVLTTSNRKIAEHTRRVIDVCKHEAPYDILWHQENITIK